MRKKHQPGCPCCTVPVEECTALDCTAFLVRFTGWTDALDCSSCEELDREWVLDTKTVIDPSVGGRPLCAWGTGEQAEQLACGEAGVSVNIFQDSDPDKFRVRVGLVYDPFIGGVVRIDWFRSVPKSAICVDYELTFNISHVSDQGVGDHCNPSGVIVEIELL